MREQSVVDHHDATAFEQGVGWDSQDILANLEDQFDISRQARQQVGRNCVVEHRFHLECAILFLPSFDE